MERISNDRRVTRKANALPRPLGHGAGRAARFAVGRTVHLAEKLSKTGSASLLEPAPEIAAGYRLAPVKCSQRAAPRSSSCAKQAKNGTWPFSMGATQDWSRKPLRR